VATCAHCGAPFRVTSDRKWFCGQACYLAHRHAHPELYGGRTGIEKPCAWCGTPTYRKPSQQRAQIFCSRSCSNQAQSATLQAHPELRTSLGAAVRCENCGDTFHVKPHRASTARFCSKPCFFAWRFGRPAHTIPPRFGDANPNYRGSSNQTTARQLAFSRYGRRCMVCGWETAVDVHHVTPVRHGGTNDVENLAVLCPNHHRMADAGLLTQTELTALVRAAAAQPPDPRPRSDPQRASRRGTVGPAPSTARPALATRPGGSGP
jgi:hypothetical protein